MHMHTALGDDNYKVIGGHLKDATVAVTAEITITPLSTKLMRIKTPSHEQLFLLDHELDW